jgi:hypothetical protein
MLVQIVVDGELFADLEMEDAELSFERNATRDELGMVESVDRWQLTLIGSCDDIKLYREF